MVVVPFIPLAHVKPDLPLSPEAAVPIMALGLVVLVAVAYDAYRVYGDRIAPRTDPNDG